MPPATGAGRPALSPVSLVWLLGVTQIVGYGTQYYAFAILSADIAADLGWSVPAVFAAFSLALFCGSLISPLAGRLVDRHGAGRMLSFGTLLTTLALVMTALAPEGWSFTGAMIAVELAATLAQYDAAFTCLVQATGRAAQRRIVQLTLIAGFASTLFWPLTGAIHAHLDWRSVILVFAALNLLVCLPAHLVIALRVDGRAPDEETGGAADARPALGDRPLPAAFRRRAFWLMTLGFTFGAFVLSGVLAQLVPLLGAAGLGAAAAVAVGAVFGPAQVAVRLVNMLLGDRRDPMAATLAQAVFLPASLLILALTMPAAPGAVAFVVLFGFGSGLSSIVRGTLPLVLFGPAGYGSLLGRMAAVRLGASALAPFALSLLVDRAGVTVALAVTAGIGALGVLAFLALIPLRRAAGSAGP